MAKYIRFDFLSTGTPLDHLPKPAQIANGTD